MTPAQIKKAEQLLAKKQELLTLRDKYGTRRGRIIAYEGGEPGLKMEDGTSTVLISTMEIWIKQAKAAAKKGII